MKKCVEKHEELVALRASALSIVEFETADLVIPSISNEDRLTILQSAVASLSRSLQSLKFYVDFLQTDEFSSLLISENNVNSFTYPLKVVYEEIRDLRKLFDVENVSFPPTASYLLRILAMLENTYQSFYSNPHPITSILAFRDLVFLLRPIVDSISDPQGRLQTLIDDIATFADEVFIIILCFEFHLFKD